MTSKIFQGRGNFDTLTKSYWTSKVSWSWRSLHQFETVLDSSLLRFLFKKLRNRIKRSAPCISRRRAVNSTRHRARTRDPSSDLEPVNVGSRSRLQEITRRTNERERTTLTRRQRSKRGRTWLMKYLVRLQRLMLQPCVHICPGKHPAGVYARITSP